jgi:hypothetical protein
MARLPNPAEERVCRAFRQANIITADQFRDAMELLTATEPCDKCAGTGNSEPEGQPPMCTKCDGTGEMRSIR